MDRVTTPPGWTKPASAKIVAFSLVEPKSFSQKVEEFIATTPRQPLPDGNPKTAWGVNKPGIDKVPPVAIMEMGRVMQHGAAKYGPMNWRHDRITFSTYYNAALRHLFAMLDGEWIDPESGLPHAAHVMAGMGVMIDAHDLGMMNDDRPKVGRAADYIREQAERNNKK